MNHKRIGNYLFGIGLTISIMLLFSTTRIASRTSFLEAKMANVEQTITQTPVGYPFLVRMNCPNNMLVDEGPTWRGVTVGKSTIDDIEEVYGIRFNLEQGYDPSLAPLYSVHLTSSGTARFKLPQNAFVCLLHGKVAAINLSVIGDAKLLGQNLPQWTVTYGSPELVTWADNDWEWRLLLWPKDGFALLVHVLGVDVDQKEATLVVDQNTALVDSVFFFPFAKGKDYQSQWPYSSLRRIPPDVENIHFPTAENPFDFGSLIGTTQPTLKATLSATVNLQSLWDTNHQEILDN